MLVSLAKTTILAAKQSRRAAGAHAFAKARDQRLGRGRRWDMLFGPAYATPSSVAQLASWLVCFLVVQLSYITCREVYHLLPRRRIKKKNGFVNFVDFPDFFGFFSEFDVSQSPTVLLSVGRKGSKASKLKGARISDGSLPGDGRAGQLAPWLEEASINWSILL